MSKTILCSTTYVPFDANLNLLKKNRHLSQSFQFIYFTVGFVLNEINFLDILIILLHCDLICLPTKWFPYTFLFLIQLLITHYSDTVRFFMKSVLTVYIGFQSYDILYANYMPIINFLTTIPNFVFLIPIWLPSLVIIQSNDVHVNPGPNNSNKVFILQLEL